MNVFMFMKGSCMRSAMHWIIYVSDNQRQRFSFHLNLTSGIRQTLGNQHSTLERFAKKLFLLWQSAAIGRGTSVEVLCPKV
jgi:hypothetical protein